MDWDDRPFLGKRALVVGGSGGIGRAVALGLGKLGAAVTVHGGASSERLERTVAAIRADGGQARGFLCPYCEKAVAADRNSHDGSTIEAFARKILTAEVEPDILICAWGPYRRAALEETALEDWCYLVSCNLILPGMLVSSVLPAMIARNWGRILLFGGTNTDTIRGFTTTAAYSAAKTALGTLAKSVGRLNPGVTCNVICPGLTDTEYVDDAARAYNASRSPGGALKAEDIARAALAVLRDPALNGAVIPVDGGLCL
jgi:NAD(P)-dependent dehydrogenase (short-subunit alcohol dehydrogenase family)